MNKEYILECLNKYCDFSQDLTSWSFEELVCTPLSQACCFDNEKWSWDSGATKGVLIFDELNYVIKIPFRGSDDCSDWPGHYEDEDGNCYDSWKSNRTWVEDEDFCPYSDFAGAEDEKDGWDYCEAERLKFFKAEDEQCAEYFAATIFIGFVGKESYPIYAQEKASCIGCNYSKERSKEETDKSHSLQRALSFYLNDGWVADFIKYFGETAFTRLAQFCEDYCINDLHDGNIGYIQDRPVLIDYSAFNR